MGAIRSLHLVACMVLAGQHYRVKVEYLFPYICLRIYCRAVHLDFNSNAGNNKISKEQNSLTSELFELSQ
jgi:hypothetical protein